MILRICPSSKGHQNFQIRIFLFQIDEFLVVFQVNIQPLIEDFDGEILGIQHGKGVNNVRTHMNIDVLNQKFAFTYLWKK